MQDGKIIEDQSVFPRQQSYAQGVVSLITKLHFGEFGGVLIKVFYFILSMITCFVILSGVMIWRTARDNNRYTLLQRIFHHRVTKFNLAVCLSLFPAFALLFITNKIIPFEWHDRVFWVNYIFFLGWLFLTVIGLNWNKYSKLNSQYLMIGAVLSMLVPISNGLVTGSWFWLTINELPLVFGVDVFWLMAGFTALILALKLPKKDGSDFPKAILGRKKEKEYAVEKNLVIN
jgi:hypothetical protein